MLYFIVTTSILNECETRKTQYINGITKLKQIITNLNIPDYKIIIVENNGHRHTYLDTLECDVLYTTNNWLHENKGGKELQDILNCIKYFNINDYDFIVKMTGRYILTDNSEFMNIIQNIHNTKYECVIKYGPYFNYGPKMQLINSKIDDCVTGLIGMSCMYIKQIEKPDLHECVEWKWGKVTQLIDDSNICILNKLGIHICPLSNTYFLV
jgi:hypothetical protein